jgi:hypothetical protein
MLYWTSTIPPTVYRYIVSWWYYTDRWFLRKMMFEKSSKANSRRYPEENLTSLAKMGECSHAWDIITSGHWCYCTDWWWSSCEKMRTIGYNVELHQTPSTLATPLHHTHGIYSHPLFRYMSSSQRDNPRRARAGTYSSYPFGFCESHSTGHTPAYVSGAPSAFRGRGSHTPVDLTTTVIATRGRSLRERSASSFQAPDPQIALPWVISYTHIYTFTSISDDHIEKSQLNLQHLLSRPPTRRLHYREL